MQELVQFVARVVDLTDRVVGTVIAGWDGWRAHLYRLAVAPDLRGRGIARQLLPVKDPLD